MSQDTLSEPRAETAAIRKPVVTGFFDPRTFSIQYVVADPGT